MDAIAIQHRDVGSPRDSRLAVAAKVEYQQWRHQRLFDQLQHQPANGRRRMDDGLQLVRDGQDYDQIPAQCSR
jgi:hypothetical protein